MAGGINDINKQITDFSSNQKLAAESSAELTGSLQQAGSALADFANPLGGLKSVFASLWDSKGVIGFSTLASTLTDASKKLEEIQNASMGVTRAMGPMKDQAVWQKEIVAGAQQLGIEYNEYASAIESANKHHAALSMSQKDFMSFAKNAAQFGDAIGASAQEGADAFGKLVGEAKVGAGVIKSVQKEMLALQNSVGMAGKEVINLINTGITPLITQLKLLGASDVELKKTVKAVGDLATAFTAAGIEGGKAADMVNRLTDPEKLQDNIMLYNQMGISISDTMGAMTGKGGMDTFLGQVTEKLPEVAKRVASMGYAGVQYAKSMGMNYKELLQMQNMSGKEAKEAADKKAKENKEQDTFNKQWQQTMDTWKKWSIGLAQAFDNIRMSIMDAFGEGNFKDIKELPIELGKMFAQFLKDIHIGEIVKVAVSFIKMLIQGAKGFMDAIRPALDSIFNSGFIGKIGEMLKGVGTALGNVMARFAPLFEKLTPMLGKIMSAFTGAIEKVGPKIEGMISRLGPLVDYIISHVDDILKAIFPFFDKIDKLVSDADPKEILAALGIGGAAAGGGFLVGIGEDLGEGLMKGISKGFKGWFTLGLSAAVAAADAAAKEVERRSTTESGSISRSVDLAKSSKSLQVKGKDGKMEVDKKYVNFLQEQEKGMDKLEKGTLKLAEAQKISEGLMTNQVQLEKTRVELMKGGEFGEYLNNLNAEAKLKNKALELQGKSPTEKVYATQAINKPKEFDAMLAEKDKAMMKGNFDKAFSSFIDEKQMSADLKKALANPIEETIHGVMSETDKKLKAEVDKFKADTMAKAIDKTFEPFVMFRKKINEQVAHGIITPEQALAALNKQKSVLENMSKNMTERLNQSAASITGVNQGVISKTLSGIVDSIVEWAEAHHMGTAAAAVFGSSKERQKDKDTNTAVSDAIAQSLQNLPDKLESSDQLKAIISQKVTELGGDKVDTKKSGEMIDKFMKSNDYTVKNLIRGNKELKDTMTDIAKYTKTGNDQRGAGNAKIEEIAENTKPKRPVRMINLNELAMRASEQGATMLTFGGK